MSNSTIQDSEFGSIAVHRYARSRSVRVKVAPNGTLRVSAPVYTPLFMIRRVIAGSRDELRRVVAVGRPILSYQNGDSIGKSHSLIVQPTTSSLRSSRRGLAIVLSLPEGYSLSDNAVQVLLRAEVIAALRREAKGYLPKRLRYLADQHGFSYERVRFSHASSRWGSCSSSGTISLNIALMKLPFELIDYVLIHELAHTRHMDHSKSFWLVVSAYDPQYHHHKTLLAKEVPSI